MTSFSLCLIAVSRSDIKTECAVTSAASLVARGATMLVHLRVAGHALRLGIDI
jgi:hypothetical protein